ncbi:LOW QUALITY PROTEIN: bridge-like lipid transfer protein family member 3B [Physeter macrocephalus]|uniref:LOW QUALITY PROTEIN: bridge-like lipid transfer protein family member 3B n=1 Tax=Physeter macrocephalus TaxID=9755 RepID=A0A2Y9SWF5_PHYMC|nr:LOW QUALITY PROTEIN: bridge-like lipid transfer protein family member 3B [Physeter catodon]|eukprot:XP_023982986.1 LOW QUALITY PROTEIN: UHRF1-binding protein 1-like [Physeter catodon]
MAGLIKKQILKHLSRFTKNLSPDKINLSTLKGEGELKNLELDEEVLQNMLDLPTWLAINKVFCNKASIRIPWTKLKTHPICLSLDKVIMEMSTCEEPRNPNGPSPIATASGQSEYGFAEKVVEGITVSVNSIVIRIGAKAFNASFELSQLRIYSVNANWEHGDLRFARIQDPQRGEVLTFKEINWQMIRIEADATQSSHLEIMCAPVRLITNQSKIRVTLKRRLKDCNVIATKLVLMLDDLLWVLTDSQLKAMVQYAKSLSEAIEKSTEQRKSMAPEPTQSSTVAPSTQQVKTPQTSNAPDLNDAIVKLFSDFDVKETSHHLVISHLDLHICDDIHAKEKESNRRITGGAMQLSFTQLTVDYYPYHKAGDSCNHWMYFSDATKIKSGWANELLHEFECNVEMLKQAVKDHDVGSPPKSPTHASPQHTQTEKDSTLKGTSKTPTVLPQQSKVKLMSSSVVVRLADFNIYQVSTAEQCRSSPKSMISCNKKSLYLPQEMSAVYIEFTEYYYPDGKDFPIPSPNLYSQLNALQFTVDERSILWLNQFLLDLKQSLNQFMAVYKLNDNSKSDEHVDIRVDGLMLKFVIPSEMKSECHQDQPHAISIQSSEMIATNTRYCSNCRHSDLEALFQDFKDCDFFSKTYTSFPKSGDSFNLLHPIFQRHAHEQDTKLHEVYKGNVTPKLNKYTLKTSAATDVWAVYFSQFWIDYEGMKSGKGRPINFVDSFPLSLWICQPKRYALSQKLLQTCNQISLNTSQSESSDLTGRWKRKKLLKEYYSTESDPLTNGSQKPSDTFLRFSSSSSEADIHVLVHIHKHVSMQINHYQYLLLLFLHESLILLSENLRKDVEAVTGNPASQTSICIGILLKSAEVALLLHPVDKANSLKSPVSESVSPVVPDYLPTENGEFLSSERKQVSGIKQIRSVTVNHMSDNRSMSIDLSHVPLKDSLLFKSASDTNLQKGISFLDYLSDKNLGKISEDESSGIVCKSGSGEIGSETSGKKDSSYTDSNSVLNYREDSSMLSFDNGGNQNILSNSLTSKENETIESIFKAEDLLPETVSLSENMEISKEEAPTVGTLKSQSSLSRKPKERCLPNMAPLSVSYKNMRRSPSQTSLDTISLDSMILEEQLLESDGSDSHIFLEKGIKKNSTINYQSPADRTNASSNLQNYGETSPDAISTNSEGAQENHDDLMSVVVFKIIGVNGEIDIRGEDMEICLQVDQVTPDQLGNISLRHYLCNRPVGSDHKAVIHSKSSPVITLRFESGPGAVIHSLLAEKNGFLQCHIENFSTEFLISSLINIQHFLEDETVATVMPMKIQISNTKINLKDDSPRSSTVSLEPAPVTVHIDHLVVERNDDGSFHIRDSQMLNTRNDLKEDVKSDSVLLTSGKCDLKKQHSVTQATQTSPEVPWPSRSVNFPECSFDFTREQLMEENESLKQELAKAKTALAEAHLEKDALLHHIKKMQLNSRSGSQKLKL